MDRERLRARLERAADVIEAGIASPDGNVAMDAVEAWFDIIERDDWRRAFALVEGEDVCP